MLYNVKGQKRHGNGWTVSLPIFSYSIEYALLGEVQDALKNLVCY